MKTCIRSLAIGVLLAAALFSQDADGRRGIPVRGEIYSTGPMLGSLTVELRTNGMGIPETAMVNPDGSFELRFAAPGMHQLRVIGPHGGVIHQEMVVIGSPNQRLSIRLPDAPGASRSGASRSADSSISLNQLRHKVPSAARKAYEKGEQAAAKSQHLEAAESFRKAVEIDPEFADAFNELGAAEAALGDLPKAAEQFQKAIDLAPDHRLALPNLSIVLAKMKRFSDAGKVARRALRVVPGSCPIHFIIAASLLMEDGDRDEILGHLDRASVEIPRAHLLAANLLTEMGRRDDAARHLQDYLRNVPLDDADRSKVERQLAQLQP